MQVLLNLPLVNETLSSKNDISYFILFTRLFYPFSRTLISLSDKTIRLKLKTVLAEILLTILLGIYIYIYIYKDKEIVTTEFTTSSSKFSSYDFLVIINITVLFEILSTIVEVHISYTYNI